jgi:hypothetical protein
MFRTVLANFAGNQGQTLKEWKLLKVTKGARAVKPALAALAVRWQVEAAERANNENSADLPAGQVTLVFTNLLQVPDTPIAAGHLSS